MRHLWQRIFAYTLVLIAVSQAAVFYLHIHSVDTVEVRRFITDHSRAIASAMDGRSFADANAVARIFNRKNDRVWLEDRNGNVLAGKAPEGRSGAPAPLDKTAPGETYIYDIENMPGYYVTITPLTLSGSEAWLFMSFRPPLRSAMRTVFFQGMVALSVTGVLTAFWMAWRVSRPLRSLRNEVMEIAAGNLDRRVTVHGKDEINDVALAVNHMADTLAKNIRSMRELVANISHEMRSPLARMQVSLALLEEDVEKVSQSIPQAAPRVAILGEELNHMNTLIGTTLLSSKLDLQGTDVRKGTVAFSELCREMCRRHAPVFAERNLGFIHSIEDGVQFEGDETLLTTLVSNLLDNAAKYARPEGSVSLVLSTGGGVAELEVTNDHDPLPQQTLDHIFEPFYRGGIATGNGVGLGLSLVWKIAALHRGKAAATNAGNGVRFAVTFPLDT